MGLEKSINKIQQNVNVGLENLTFDMENMENYDDVPAIPIRKRVRPAKKDVDTKKRRVEITKVEDFLQDEAEGIYN